VRSHAQGAIRMRRTTGDVAVSNLNQSGYDKEGDAHKPEIKISLALRV